ncbi:MAG: tRNA (guanosine(46)-N7)-methyltransferase TrmB [Pseudomonadota bacterium]
MSSERSENPHKFRRSEAFFGRRKAKALSPKAEARFLELFPRLSLDVASSTPENASELFVHKPEKIIIEIGFGGGEHLLHQARTHPQNGYIGIEPFVNSMAKALRVIDEDGIQNIRLYNEDAVEVLDWLPEASVDRIDLMYPDPWPKMRHWKRRFVSDRNLDRFARVIRPGGRFHFASDIETYVNWTLQHCHRHSAFEWLAAESNDWRRPFDNWTRTRYEAKAVREGRTPCYLRFAR